MRCKIYISGFKSDELKYLLSVRLSVCNARDVSKHNFLQNYTMALMGQRSRLAVKKKQAKIFATAYSLEVVGCHVEGYEWKIDQYLDRFRPISETIQDTAIVTMEDESELVYCDMSNGANP